MGSIDSSSQDNVWEGVAENLKSKYKLIKQMQVCLPRSGKQRMIKFGFKRYRSPWQGKFKEKILREFCQMLE